MAGAWASGRMAGKVAPKRQIRDGFVIMLATSLVNVVANALFTPHAAWALWPLAVFAFGWALMVPVVTLLVLDLHPERRGMASSLQAVIGSTANGVVAGVIAPLVMHSTLALATTRSSCWASDSSPDLASRAVARDRARSRAKRPDDDANRNQHPRARLIPRAHRRRRRERLRAVAGAVVGPLFTALIASSLPARRSAAIGSSRRYASAVLVFAAGQPLAHRAGD
jgi:MFS family permease